MAEISDPVRNMDGTVSIDGYTFRTDEFGGIEVFGVRHQYVDGQKTELLDWYVPKQDNSIYIQALGMLKPDTVAVC
jgi:hypothetical protein